ncbi:hypothetical protein PTE01_25520 [Pseudoalteromonas tetraodonis GFC]|uniref:TnsA endonuclease N-terminal domain-containing protein n=1 Tax=Pseudoalteromonas tetraodonis GFC TaxID=1315271 RepID=A0AA37S1Z4_9GAMM|nr:TnsA endonuclease N-terminal domain-containing protein [Pseudoalteromonas tetraodonis]ATD04690.1 hypothetical protein PTET_a3519 [Pseudoalteromonas tetraodonis]GEN39442.1 hypothetical protein PTE01_25520 [Pseudoalteromonas tetraodonis GFC]GLQ02663.1 hypothetical protein GCM10007914_15440 [Pseudoalteromonas tetraodonis GFC]
MLSTTNMSGEAQMSLKLNEIVEEAYVPDKDYQPGATVHTVSSKGQMRRVKSRTTGRIEHTLSLLEYMVFIILDMDPQVVDIQSQYPHDLKTTLKLAHDLGINHSPQYEPEKKPLTTDFVVTLDGPEHEMFGVYVKYVQDLKGWRTIEKLQLERASLARLGIPLYVVTEEQICRKTHRTLEWIIGANLDDCDVDELYSHVATIENVFLSNPDERIHNLLVALDEEKGGQDGTYLYRFKQLVQLGAFFLKFDRDFFDLRGADIQVVNEVLHA